MSSPQIILSLSCPDAKGIVAAVSTHLFDAGCNILEAHQFNDVAADHFFTRVRFNAERETNIENMRSAFKEVASRFSMSWRMQDRTDKQRVVIMVSKMDHCLADLLYRWRVGEIPMDIVGIIANYPRETYSNLDFDGIPSTTSRSAKRQSWSRKRRFGRPFKMRMPTS
jgi:formyltetrahydrofolate deformylase